MKEVVADLVSLAKRSVQPHKPIVDSCCDYYSRFYFCHICYVCLQLRRSAGALGLRWWRSLLLAFLLSNLSRLSFCWMCQIPNGFADLSHIVFHSFLIWSAFNICPFDLVTKLFNFSIIGSLLSGIVAILAAWGHVDLMAFCCGSAHLGAFSSPPAVFLMIVLAFAAPIAVDEIDTLICRRRRLPTRTFMVFPWPFMWRIVVGAAILLWLRISVAEAKFRVGIGGAVWKLIDILFCENTHDVCVFACLVRACGRLITWHPM
jgi:hypothetical protein